MKKNIDIFLLSLFIFPVIPAYLLYTKNNIFYSLILVLSFWFLGIICLISPKLKKILKQITDKILCILGKFITTVLLSIGYVFVVVPTFILMKIAKRDRLKITKQNCLSYWIDTEDVASDYERQF